MSFTLMLVLSLVMSADAFVFGLSFGAKGIKIKAFSMAVITLTGFLVIMASAIAGNLISDCMTYGNIIGAFILIGAGMWLCSDNDENIKGVLDNPEKADLNKSKNIEPLEAVVTGFVLSIDCSAIVLGSAIGSGIDYILAVFVLIFQIVFIMAGVNIAHWGIKSVPERVISILSGFIILLIGLYKLSLVFS